MSRKKFSLLKSNCNPLSSDATLRQVWKMHIWNCWPEISVQVLFILQIERTGEDCSKSLQILSLILTVFVGGNFDNNYFTSLFKIFFAFSTTNFCWCHKNYVKNLRKILSINQLTLIWLGFFRLRFLGCRQKLVV